MGPDVVVPPEGVGGQQPDLPTPGGTGQGVLGGAVQGHGALVGIEVGKGPEQEGFTGAGRPAQAEAGGGGDGQMERSEPAEAEFAGHQSGGGWSDHRDRIRRCGAQVSQEIVFVGGWKERHNGTH